MVPAVENGVEEVFPREGTAVGAAPTLAAEKNVVSRTGESEENVGICERGCARGPL